MGPPPPTPPNFLYKQLFHSISYVKQPYTESYIIKGAQFRGGVTAIHVAPKVDVITDCDALCTAEETEKEREGGHDERSLRGGGSPLTDPLR